MATITMLSKPVLKEQHPTSSHPDHVLSKADQVLGRMKGQKSDWLNNGMEQHNMIEQIE